MENGPDPKRAEAAADRLSAPLAGDAGHLVHMPAHIYYRLGRWKDSIRVNIDAAHQDEAYIRESDDKGFVRYGYYPHNVHFIVTSAQMGGDLPTAISEAKRLASIVDAGTATQLAWVQAIYAAPYFATLQFASPAEVLALPEPDPRLAYVQGIRHYVRAVAYAQQNNQRGFDAELAELKRIRRLGRAEADGRPGHARARPAGARRACRAAASRPRSADATCQAADHFRAGARDRGPASPTWSRPGGIIRSTSRWARRSTAPANMTRRAQAFTAALAKYPEQWLGALRPGLRRTGARPPGAGGGGPGRAQPRLAGRSRWLKMERI